MTDHDSDKNEPSQPLTVDEVTEALLEITRRNTWSSDGGQAEIDAYAKKYLNLDLKKLREQIR